MLGKSARANELRGPIGVFDSGFGGLTVLRALRARLPDYDYVYLGDSARVPYGNRSNEAVYEFTREALFELFVRGCPLVVLACNTASARALRRIQQEDLQRFAPDRCVLGVVRPSAEALAGLSPGAVPGVTAPALISGTVAVLATPGTVASDSYRLELAKLAPRLTLIQQACTLWVPLVEAGEIDTPGTDYFLNKYLAPLFASGATPPSRLLLGCTHYPLLLPALRSHVPKHVEILPQGPLVAERLEDWLVRHPEIELRLCRGGTSQVLTTDDPSWFSAFGERALGTPFQAMRIRLSPFEVSARHISVHIHGSPR
jgi:glutamate racemase